MPFILQIPFKYVYSQNKIGYYFLKQKIFLQKR